MRRIGRFRRLPARERALLVRAGATVAFVRMALWLLPLRRVLTLVRRTPPPVGRAPADPADAETRSVVRAVRTVSSLVPGATCLTQALAAQTLLARRGRASELRFGVARAEGSLEAHAWLEGGGTVVIGDLPDLERFRPLPPLEPKRRS